MLAKLNFQIAEKTHCINFIDGKKATLLRRQGELESSNKFHHYFHELCD
jgi:hypothetical protein